MSVLEGFDDQIKDDNIDHLNRYKNNPPSASYIGGFIDGDGCIFIRKIRDGFQSGIQILQSRANILLVIKYHFGGTISQSHAKKNEGSKTVRKQYNLAIRSNEYDSILNYIFHHIIVKTRQIKSLMLMSKYVNKPNKIDEKNKQCKICSDANKNKSVDEFYLNMMNVDYISGLFDAEGCLFISKNNVVKFYISLTQKSYPQILTCIQNYLGFGNIDYKEGKYKIYSKNNCLKFIELIENNLIVKFNQVKYFKQYLMTDDKKIKFEMYQKCNYEKHANESFDLEMYSNDFNFNRHNYGNLHQLKKAYLCEILDKN